MTAAGSNPWDALAGDAAAMANGPQRQILGIVGPPGAGKSVLAQVLVTRLTERGLRVGLAAMDGFHLAGAELDRLGRTQRKGAPDTFDVLGYLNLLRRLRRRDEAVVYAPLFDRALEEPIGSAVPLPRELNLIITEGNYLLGEAERWADIRAMLDECWYVELNEQVRLERLVERHIAFGRSREQARERAYGSDQRNARLVVDSRRLASRIVVVPDLDISA
jgi:pantothenate kinase